MARGGKGGAGFDVSLLFSNLILLGTLGLSVIAWIIAFISQIASEAQDQRQTVLWFNVFLQLFLILGIAATIMTDSVALSRLQLSAFLAVALVFAVEGINQGIYSGDSSRNAVTAGWFILTLVDIIWLLYFTASEDSAVFGLLSSFGNGRLSGPGTQRSGGAPMARGNNNSSNGGAIGSGGVGGGYGGSYSATGMQGGGNASGYQPTYGQAPSAADITQGGMSVPKSQTAGTGSIRSANAHGAPGGALLAGTAGARSDISHGGAGHQDPVRDNAASSAHGGGVGVGDGGSTTAGEPMPGYGYRARALYAYTANVDDPTEISFAKGEILDIVDNSGKWWQARKSNGETGIVPSNYMQVL